MINADKKTITVKGIGNFTGELNPDFEIERKSITAAIAIAGTYTYAGSQICPTVTVLDSDSKAIPADQYTIDYGENVNAGTDTITVDFSGATLAAETVVEANTEYTWKFTPTDTTNYNTVSGEGVLWKKAASSGSSNPTCTPTVTQPSVGGKIEVSNTYSDVKSTEYYAAPIAWATEQGIVNGMPNGKFMPNEPITREQMVKMLWVYLGSPEASGDLSQFPDGDKVNDYAKTAMAWVIENGVVTGRANGTLDPRGSATRAEAATMFMNYYNK